MRIQPGLSHLLRFASSCAIIAAVVVGASLMGPQPAAADNSATYDYLIGTGFLCDLGPGVCPDIAMASNGDTIEITGSGTLGIHPKSVTGSGTFVHKNSDGDVLASGTWEAMTLLSFKAYAPAPPLSPPLSGGTAQILVQLSVDGTPVHTAILSVDCDLGTNPPGQGEGVRLAVQGALNFNKKVSGGNIFIQTSP